MSARQEIPNLHDATLERVLLNWEHGLARIELAIFPGRPFVMTAFGLRAFSMSRRQDWGPSVSVNSVEVRTDGEDPIVLKIEMQSGDVITVAAERLETA